MNSLMIRFFACFAFCFGLTMTPSAAKAVSLQSFDISIAFDAVKTKHTCHSQLLNERLKGENGTCGLYAHYDFDQSYSGALGFSANFSLADGVYTLQTGGAEIRPTCAGADICPGSLNVEEGRFSRHEISFYLRRDSYSVTAVRFNRDSGVGYLEFEDDDDPYSKVYLRLTDATVDGLDNAFAGMPAVPLPASGPMLLLGLGLLRLRRRELSAGNNSPVTCSPERPLF